MSNAERDELAAEIGLNTEIKSIDQEAAKRVDTDQYISVLYRIAGDKK